MKIIEPSIEIITDLDNNRVLKQIELAARNCYKSEDKITSDISSAEKIIKMLLDNHHEAMIEFADIMVRLICDIGVYKDLTRHRHCSFAIESTRYCNYSKGKFGSELTFIKPCNIEELSDLWTEWACQMKETEITYRRMAELGAKPDQLRMILPHSTAASVVMKANIREWRHILKLRTSNAAHPAVQQIMKMVLYKFKDKLPLLFNDILTDIEIKRNEIIDILKCGVHTVTFQKDDGTIREINCTLKDDIISNSFSNDTTRKKPYNPNILSVYDIDEGWKTFRIKSLIDIK